jgi:hypothetical protein
MKGESERAGESERRVGGRGIVFKAEKANEFHDFKFVTE